MNKLNQKRNLKVFFRKFSRKRFSVFISLRKVVHISNLAFAYTLIVAPSTSIAQEDSIPVLQNYDLDEVEVLGQMATSDLLELPRMVAVVSSDEIQHSPSLSLTDILSYSANVDIRQRGKAGIQSDISIRGGSFDHNLILLNGISISDPQTGHLSLNLPIEKQAINRIELLNGPAARVHGANAVAGAINFVTRPSEVNSISLSSSYGDYGFFSNSATVNISSKNSRNLLHYNNAFSDGYAPNTDFKRQSVFYHGEVITNEGILDIQLGYSDRGFGANGFYTPKFPDQYEQNQMSYLAVGYKSGKKIKVHPQIYWRRHRDRWEMFRVDDEWYRVENGLSISNDLANTTFDTSFVFTNHHITDVVGAKFNLSTKSKYGTSTIGFHLRNEGIISTNIGNPRVNQIPIRGYDNQYYTQSDQRSNFDVHFEQNYTTQKLKLSGGLLVNWNSFRPEEINVFPGADIRYQLVGDLHIVGSYNYTLGNPTFTDLHYKDPNNIGNKNLQPYSLHSYEGGLQWLTGSSLFNASVFQVHGADVIDWVWFEDETKYKPINVSKYSSRGIELSSQFDLKDVQVINILLSKFRANYTYVDMDKDLDGNIVKYANIRHKVAAILSKDIIDGLKLSVNLNYTEREGGYRTYNFDEGVYVDHDFKPYFLMDVQVSYKLFGFTVFADVTNVLDVNYIDIGSIYQPGRWIIGGIKYTLTDF